MLAISGAACGSGVSLMHRHKPALHGIQVNPFHVGEHAQLQAALAQCACLCE